MIVIIAKVVISSIKRRKNIILETLLKSKILRHKTLDNPLNIIETLLSLDNII